VNERSASFVFQRKPTPCTLPLKLIFLLIVKSFSSYFVKRN
jgi:hypothetical protein